MIGFIALLHRQRSALKCFVLAALGGALAFGFAATSAQAEVRLRASPTASGPMITLGDVLEGLPERAAKTPIARTPSAGNTLSFDARALADRARSLGVIWKPPAGLFRVTLAGPETTSADGLLSVSDIEQPEMPVLARALATGDVITSSDIVMNVVDGRLPADTVNDLTALIGQAAKRPLIAGRPVRASDIRTPLAIKKGDTVTLLYSVGPVRLSARGRALADASIGEPVRVLNPQSNKTVDAFATGSGEARVSPAAAASLSASLAFGAYQ